MTTNGRAHSLNGENRKWIPYTMAEVGNMDFSLQTTKPGDNPQSVPKQTTSKM